MPTEIVQVDADALPRSIGLRDDVDSVLVVVTTCGRPVKMLRLPRPSNGVLTTAEIASRFPAQSRSASTAVRQTRSRISVVVCTHERPDDLSRCLESLASVANDGHEVIVVDSGPTTTRTAEVAGRFHVRFLTEEKRGLNRARNAGITAAAHDIVAFVDDDVVVSPGWLNGVAAAFEDPAVGCVTGLVLPLELETAAQEQFELYCQHRRDFESHIYSKSVLPASAAGIVGMGANMSYRRTLVRDLGLFDVRLDAGTCTRSGGDTDMFARVLDAGQLIVYSPEAQVWHRHRREEGELRSCVFGYGVGLSGMLTKRVVEQRDFRAIVTAGRWLVGPLVKAARAKIARRSAPRWTVVLAETAGAAVGPFCFAYETWRMEDAR